MCPTEVILCAGKLHLPTQMNLYSCSKRTSFRGWHNHVDVSILRCWKMVWMTLSGMNGQHLGGRESQEVAWVGNMLCTFGLQCCWHCCMKQRGWTVWTVRIAMVAVRLVCRGLEYGMLWFAVCKMVTACGMLDLWFGPL